MNTLTLYFEQNLLYLHGSTNTWIIGFSKAISNNPSSMVGCSPFLFFLLQYILRPESCTKIENEFWQYENR